MTAREDLDHLAEQVRAIQPADIRRRMKTQIRDHARSAFGRGFIGWLLARPRSRRITILGAWLASTAVTTAARYLPAQPTARIINYALVVMSAALLLALVPVVISGRRRRRRRGRGPGLPPPAYDWGSSAAAADVCCRLCPVEDVAAGEQRKHSCVCHELTPSKQPDHCTQCGRSFGDRACGFTHALVAIERSRGQRKGGRR